MKRIKNLEELLDNGISLKDAVVHGLDFSKISLNWRSLHVTGCVFLGCKFRDEDRIQLFQGGAYLFERPEKSPYDPYRADLYHWQELSKTSESLPLTSVDHEIYGHFQAMRNNPPILESLMQRIHDHAIDDALRQLIMKDGNTDNAKKCVGIMGGHSTSRKDPYYHKIALLSKWLAESEYLLVSGGGPGIMEAANLGACLAGKEDALCTKIIRLLSKAPNYRDDGYMEAAIESLGLIGTPNVNLAIPTWFYGHEPSNVYATHIAKYFSNSIREDTLLAICLHGIVFAPGSAGTTQEIFMDATQNHYGTFQYYSPMVFLGKQRYEIDTLIFPLLKQLAWTEPYANFLFLSDDPGEIVQFIKSHPPLMAG